MAKHSLGFVEPLLDMANGEGGQMIAVIGEATTSGDYWAGSRLLPVKTLLEAVLRCILSGPYGRVIAFTGQGSNHLPNWKLGSSFRLGDEAMIWMARGSAKKQPDRPALGSLMPWEQDTSNDLKKFAVSSIERLLWRSDNRPYWDRLEEYIKRRDKEISDANGDRCALVVEYSFLVPTAHEARHLGASVIDQRLMNNIRAGIKKQLQGTKIDIVLISEDGMALDFLQEKKSNEPSIILRVAAGSMSQHEWQQVEPRVQAIPHFCIGEEAEVVEAERMSTPLPGSLFETRSDKRAQRLYDMLRLASINRRPSAPAPPKRADEVALEFWANIDLAPLKNAFDNQIIGQTAAKSIILSLLEEHKEKCASVLTRSADTRITSKDTDFCLPAIGLFGAAGMGKTTMCKIIVENLFSDQQFGRLIDLGGKSLKIATIGVEPPMFGCDDESDLISFARTTKGLGIVCFDEFTRIALQQNTTLANSLAPLLQILQDRYFEPSNPKFRPPTRFFHLANTLFVFAGNVSPSGVPPAHGFCSIDELGPAFTRRVSVPIYFEPLNSKDYREAARHALRRSAMNWAGIYNPNAAAAEIIVDQTLLDAVENRLIQVTQSLGEEPSISRLNTLVRALPYGKAFDAAQEQSSNKVVLNINLVPQEWLL